MEHDVGSSRYVYKVVFLPSELTSELPLKKYPRLRITGEINDYPFDAALTPVRGRWYILLSETFMRRIKATVGDSVSVRFAVDDQSAVEVPEELQQTLRENPAMRSLWDASTPGMQRGLAYRVSSAKRPETRRKRIELVFAILRGEIDQRGKPIA